MLEKQSYVYFMNHISDQKAYPQVILCELRSIKGCTDHVSYTLDRFDNRKNQVPVLCVIDLKFGVFPVIDDSSIFSSLVIPEQTNMTIT